MKQTTIIHIAQAIQQQQQGESSGHDWWRTKYILFCAAIFCLFPENLNAMTRELIWKFDYEHFSSVEARHLPNNERKYIDIILLRELELKDLIEIDKNINGLHMVITALDFNFLPSLLIVEEAKLALIKRLDVIGCTDSPRLPFYSDFLKKMINLETLHIERFGLTAPLPPLPKLKHQKGTESRSCDEDEYDKMTQAYIEYIKHKRETMHLPRFAYT
jgi:hypothetical protein